MLQAQPKGHPPWTICAASRALAWGGRGAATPKTRGRKCAMEMAKKAWCLRGKRMAVCTAHSRCPVDAPTVCPRAWWASACLLHLALHSKDGAHRLLRFEGILKKKSGGTWNIDWSHIYFFVLCHSFLNYMHLTLVNTNNAGVPTPITFNAGFNILLAARHFLYVAVFPSNSIFVLVQSEKGLQVVACKLAMGITCPTLVCFSIPLPEMKAWTHLLSCIDKLHNNPPGDMYTWV